MLGLGQQVGGDPVGIVAAVGDDQHFRRAGDHVDADGAEDLALGRRDIGVAGADDLGDRRDRLGAIGKRRDRLRAADAVDLVDAGNVGRDQHQRIDRAAGRRHDHDDALDAGDLGRNGVHQHRARIARRAARHVEADRLDRRPARAELDAERRRCSGRPSAAAARDGRGCGRARSRAPRSVCGSAASSAPAISSGETAMPSACQVDPVELSACSRSAPRRPRRARRAMMSRTAASTSADTSRLVGEEGGETLLEIGVGLVEA